jgi:ectoine hydroxylase-related dioxygenase (phytanoyl-CoA dioxygenase family)
MIVKYTLGEKEIELELQGNTFFGEEEILLLKDENLIEGTSWKDEGFNVVDFLYESDFYIIKAGIKELISKMIVEAGGEIDAAFELENYHSYVNNETHLRVAKLIQWGWNITEFPVDFQLISNRISEVIGMKVTSKAKHIELNNFFLRIVRPQNFQDNNPPHRDVWIDRLRDAVNIYAPICGSNENSSLGLIPGSHLLKESQIERTAEGAILNGTSYTVPCVISVNGEQPHLLRPDPKENQVMLFSPYLVHGGGYNFNDNKTRMSLEVRFWRENV